MKLSEEFQNQSTTTGAAKPCPGLLWCSLGSFYIHLSNGLPGRGLDASQEGWGTEMPACFTCVHSLEPGHTVLILHLKKRAGIWGGPLVEPLEKQLFFFIVFLRSDVPVLSLFKIHTCTPTTHIPGRRKLVSACGLRALLTYWHLSEDQICSRPRAFWCWDKTPGFHLSTIGGLKKKRWEINNGLGSLTMENYFSNGRHCKWDSQGHLKELCRHSDEEANVHLSPK